jgi:hypothetical protein
LFICRAYVLETFLDLVNCVAMRDNDLEPTTRAVHRSHHADESRHIAFDRAVISALISRMRDEGLDADIRTVARLARSYSDYAFSRLINPWIYRELGLDDPAALARDVRASASWLRRKRRCAESQEKFFGAAGLVETAE